jgi:hypothetical protein
MPPLPTSSNASWSININILQAYDMQEDLLENHLLCPLLDVRGQDDNLYSVAKAVLRWALLKSFEGALPQRELMREKFTEVWKSTYYSEYGKGIVPPDHPTFWIGPKKAAYVAGKIHDLLSKYHVLHPEQPYVLINGKDQIHGHYALLYKRSSGEKLVLNLHSHRPLNYFAPGAKALVRWKHARENHKGIISIYHLPLLRGQFWQERNVSWKAVDEYLSQIEGIGENRLPIPGSHCLSCKTQSCRGVFDGQDDNRRI